MWNTFYIEDYNQCILTTHKKPCILHRRIVKFENKNVVSGSNILHITQTNMTIIFLTLIHI